MEVRTHHLFFAAIFTALLVTGFLAANPGGLSRTLLEKAALWETFQDNYLRELPAGSGPSVPDILAEFIESPATDPPDPAPVPTTPAPRPKPIPDRWSRLIAGLEQDNGKLNEQLQEAKEKEKERGIPSADVRVIVRRIEDNQKKIDEYRRLQKKDKAG